MNDPENLICPFCGDDGFDKIGLKIHLTCWCEEYQMVTVGRYSWSPEAIRENEDEKCKRRGETSVERDKLEAENKRLRERVQSVMDEHFDETSGIYEDFKQALGGGKP
jgi:hypothetical protein